MFHLPAKGSLVRPRIERDGSPRKEEMQCGNRDGFLDHRKRRQVFVAGIQQIKVDSQLETELGQRLEGALRKDPPRFVRRHKGLDFLGKEVVYLLPQQGHVHQQHHQVERDDRGEPEEDDTALVATANLGAFWVITSLF